MSHARMLRVEELMREELGCIFQAKLTDPRIGFATISRVKVAKDLRKAVVFVSLLCDDKEANAESMQAIEHAKGFIKRLLAKNVQLKYMPDLRFIHDSSASYASHIQGLLQEAEPEDGWEDGTGEE